MKPYRIAILTTLLLILAPTILAADFGVRAGRFNDADEEFVGAELLFDLGAVNLNPNLEYSLADDTTAGTANFDLTVDIATLGRVQPYVGAGVGLSYADTDTDLSGHQTNVVGNLIGGLSFQLQFLKPYAQVKYVRVFDDDDTASSDADDDIALTIGLRF